MGFTFLDYFILATFFAGIMVFGALVGGKQKSGRDYFLGNRELPWWALAASVVAGETSALTILGAPVTSYFNESLGFLQLCIGYVIARTIVAFLFLPAYFKGELYTVYEFLKVRFGTKMQKTTSSVFILTRLLADGVRLFAGALVLTAIFKMPIVWAIILMGGVSLIYTYIGGIRAVVWTDLLLLIIYLTGGIVAFLMIPAKIPGGWDAVWSHISHTKVFNFTFNLKDTYTFWAGIIGGTFLSMASHGTDNLIVQRLLTAKNLRHSQAAIIVSGVIVFFQFLLFLVIGLMLYLFYHTVKPLPTLDNRNELLPFFVANEMPRGIGALLIVGIFSAAMSTISSSLNALSSTTVNDFYKTLTKKPVEPKMEVKISRYATAFWGVIFVLFSFLFLNTKSVLDTGLAIASYTYGGLLGVFFLGLFFSRSNQIGAISGLFSSLVIMLFLVAYKVVAWPYFVFIGTILTCIVGLVVSALVPDKKR